jgi:hypothetical protein
MLRTSAISDLISVMSSATAAKPDWTVFKIVPSVGVVLDFFGGIEKRSIVLLNGTRCFATLSGGYREQCDDWYDIATLGTQIASIERKLKTIRRDLDPPGINSRTSPATANKSITRWNELSLPALLHQIDQCQNHDSGAAEEKSTKKVRPRNT